MKRKLLVFLVLLLSCVAGTFAQTRPISGNVTDASGGGPLPGVSVRIKGTTTVVQSDGQGKFQISTATGATLQISSIGYLSQEILIANQTTLNISMQGEDTKLNEVVITAYGDTKKKAFTGSAATISSAQFKDYQVSTVTGILQGTASGVVAVTSSGQPGETETVRIRGIGSFNASQSPIYIVDDAIYGGNISNLNPADIETITVLKDASSTSLYGSRAANGVIKITTKTGKGKAKFTFTNVTGISSRAVKEYETVNTQQFYELNWEALRNKGITLKEANPAQYASDMLASYLIYNPYGNAEPVGTDGKLKDNLSLLWNDNWMDAATRTGIRNESTLNVSGSSADNNTQYLISGGYLKQDGTIIESAFKRFTGRVKVTTKLNSWLTSGANVNLSSSTQNYPYQGNAAGSNVLGFARNIAPIYPIHLRDPLTGAFINDDSGRKIFDYGTNGPLRRDYSAGQNIIGTTRDNPISYNRFNSAGNVFAEANLLEGLKFRSQYALDYYNNVNNIFWNPFYGDGSTSDGSSYRSVQLASTQTFTNTLSYDKYFGEKHHLNMIAGAEVYKYVSDLTTASRTGFTFAFPTQISYGTVSDAGGSRNAERMMSYFGRVQYDYNDKYHISASLRTDGSTRFRPDVRWGQFYSVGAAWNVNKEDFLKDVSYLSDLKLRASYGTTGNSSITGLSNNYFPYLGSYDTGYSLDGTPGVVISSVDSDNLTWEKQKQLDLGLEFGFLKDRITGSFTYYDRRSKDLIFNVQVPGSTGINNVISNNGAVRNHGFEIELRTENIRNQNVQWTTSINISRNKNEVTQVPKGTTYIQGGSLGYDWRTYEYAGVDAADGSPMWYKDVLDADGNVADKVTTKKYSEATLYYTGTSRLAKYTGGITNTVRYKNIDLSVLASFSLGGQIYDGDYQALMHNFTNVGSTASVDMLTNRWISPQQPGDGLTPRLEATTSINASSTSTRFLYSGTYLRVRNITAGYNFSPRMLEGTFIAGARIYADMQNPFTVFNPGHRGLDPEAGLNAAASGSNTSTIKTLALGINLTF